MLSGILSRRRFHLRRRAAPILPTAARHRRALSAWRRGAPRRPARSTYEKVLDALRRAGRPLPSINVAGAVGGITSSQACSHLNNGVERSHVVRDATKRKRIRYTITPSGRQYLEELGHLRLLPA